MSERDDIRQRRGYLTISREMLQDFGYQLPWQLFTALRFSPFESTPSWLSENIQFAGCCPLFSVTEEGCIPRHYDMCLETEYEEEPGEPVDLGEGEVIPTVHIGYVTKVGVNIIDGEPELFDVPKWEPLPD